MFLVVAVLVGGGIWWWSAQQAELIASAERHEAEGVAFGSGRGPADCKNEALSRAGACGPMDMLCEVGARLFLKSCIGAAKLPEGFCRRVPPEDDLMNTLQYKLSECDSDQRCARVMTAVADFCHADG